MVEAHALQPRQQQVLFVRIPTAEFRHVSDKYADLIQEAVDNLNLGYDEVKFVTADDDPSNTPIRHNGGLSAHSSSAASGTGPQSVPVCILSRDGSTGIAPRS